MPSRRVVFSYRAIRDFRSIGAESDRNWGRAQTRLYLRKIRETAAELSEFPERHAKLAIRTSGFRKVRVGSHLIIFLVGKESVEIVRILPARMDIEAEF